MTYFYYKTNSWSNGKQPNSKRNLTTVWKSYAKKKNWRITQLPNGYYQAEWQEGKITGKVSQEEKLLKELKKQLMLLLNITKKT
jgi:hypothetical protein